jgi:hypothetical protein
MNMRVRAIALVAGLIATGLGGCASLVQKASDRFAGNLSRAILDNDDPGTVRDGLPAYLLLLDSLLLEPEAGQAASAPPAPAMLYAAATLNGAYAGNFTGDDAVRAQRLAGKGFAYARRGVCIEDAPLCAAIDGGGDAFAGVVAGDTHVAAMYALATAWAGFLQANSSEWGAIADLPKIERLLLRVVELEPGHDHGQAYVYLGVLNSLRPEAVGGKPALGREYFEKAIAASGGRNLYAKTLFAQYYARLVFDQSLHDTLLNEVIAADPKAQGFTLMNTLAQDRARKLLETGKDYF